MSIFSAIVAFFRGGTASFSEFELRLLLEIAAALPESFRDVFLQRIRSVNLVQRHDGGREVNCYSIRRGKPVFDERARVTVRSGEQRLAKVAVEGPKGTANMAEVWLVDGYFFSMEFQDATEHADSSAISAISVSIDEDLLKSY